MHGADDSNNHHKSGGRGLHQRCFFQLPQPQNLIKDTLTSVGGNTFNHRQETIRIDHVVNSKLSVFGRFTNEAIPTVEPGGLFTGDALPGVATTSTNSPGAASRPAPR